MYCSDNLDLSRSEETMTSEKCIDIYSHFKYSKYSLYQQPPKRLQISTNDFKVLFGTSISCGNTSSANNDNSILIFSTLESIELEYNGYNLNNDDLSLLFSNVSTIKHVSIQFNGGDCCLIALSQLNRVLMNLNLLSFTLLFLENDGGKSNQTQIQIPVIQTTSLNKCPSSTSCIRSYISSKNVRNLEKLHLESVSVFMLQELVCSMHHERLNNLKTLVIVFDDSNLFSSISSDAFFSGLLKLPKLENLYLSISIVFLGITDTRELFDVQSFKRYLSCEQTLKTLSLDFISDDMNKVYTNDFIQYLFSEKTTLQKVSINTPIFNTISSCNKLQSLCLTYQAQLNCSQFQEIDKLISNLSSNSNLKKLAFYNDNLNFVNVFLSRLLINDRNGPIECLKVSIGKQEFCQILKSLSLNTTLKQLSLSTSTDITREHIESLLLTVQDHPSLYKITIETTCKTLCPYFLRNNYTIVFNNIKLKYYIFRK